MSDMTYPFNEGEGTFRIQDNVLFPYSLGTYGLFFMVRSYEQSSLCGFGLNLSEHLGGALLHISVASLTMRRTISPAGSSSWIRPAGVLARTGARLASPSYTATIMAESFSLLA